MTSEPLNNEPLVGGTVVAGLVTGGAAAAERTTAGPESGGSAPNSPAIGGSVAKGPATEPAPGGSVANMPPSIGRATAESGTAGPGSIEPGTLEPGTVERATAGPESGGSVANGPATEHAPGGSVANMPPPNGRATAEPGTAGPGTVEPESAGPGTVEPESAGPGTVEPETAGPGTAERATAGPGTAVPAPNVPVTGGPIAGTPRETAAPALRRRFPAGVMVRAGTTLAVGDAGELLVIGERGFSVAGADRALCAWAGRLVEGLRWPAPDAALTDGQEALLAAFAARDLLVPLPRTDTVDPYTKQRRWLAHTGTDPDAAQERIARHRAVVVGCGGTGAIVATHLCAMGVRRLLLVDHDAVEVTNFNRQFTYRRADLGRPKAQALREFLLERHPEAEIAAAQVFVDEDTISGLAPDGPGEWTLFCCADRPVGTLAALLAGFARDRGGSVIFAAAGLDEAAVGPLLRPDDTAAHRAFAQEMEAVGAVARSALADPVMSASVAPVNTVTAAWMAGEWLNGVILERPVPSLNARFVVDLGNSSTYEERTWR